MTFRDTTLSLYQQVHSRGGQFGLWPEPACEHSYLSNTGIAQHQGKIYVAQRLTSVKSGSVTERWRENRSCIVISELRLTDMSLTHSTVIKSNFPKYSLEDPRLISSPNGLQLWCAEWGHSDNQTFVRQLVINLRDDLSTISKYYPPYGFNDGRRYEKNWMPFSHGSRFVYSVSPNHTVVNTTTLIEWTTPGINGRDNMVMHGSSPAIDIGYGFLTLCQSSKMTDRQKLKLPDNLYPRKYLIWAYIFSKQPPYKIIQFSINPIFEGSYNNPITNGSPAVLFPCGLIRIGLNEVLITLGINDCRSGWIRLNLESIFSTSCESPEKQ